MLLTLSLPFSMPVATRRQDTAHPNPAWAPFTPNPASSSGRRRGEPCGGGSGRGALRGSPGAAAGGAARRLLPALQHRQLPAAAEREMATSGHRAGAAPGGIAATRRAEPGRAGPLCSRTAGPAAPLLAGSGHLRRPPPAPAARAAAASPSGASSRTPAAGLRSAPGPGGQLPLGSPPSGLGEGDGPVLTGNCGPSARETVDGDPRPRASYCRTPGSPARRAAAGALPRLSPPRRPRPAVPGRALPRGAGKERACASARGERRRERGRSCGRGAGPSHLRRRGGGLHLGQRPAPVSTGESGP